MKDKLGLNNKNLIITNVLLLLIVGLWIVYFVTGFQSAGFLYATFSLAWYTLENTMVKDTVKNTALFKRYTYLRLVYIHGPVILAFGTLLYITAAFEPVGVKLIFAVLLIIIFAVLKYFMDDFQETVQLDTDSLPDQDETVVDKQAEPLHVKGVTEEKEPVYSRLEYGYPDERTTVAPDAVTVSKVEDVPDERPGEYDYPEEDYSGIEIENYSDYRDSENSGERDDEAHIDEAADDTEEENENISELNIPEDTDENSREREQPVDEALLETSEVNQENEDGIYDETGGLKTDDEDLFEETYGGGIEEVADHLVEIENEKSLETYDDETDGDDHQNETFEELEKQDEATDREYEEGISPADREESIKSEEAESLEDDTISDAESEEAVSDIEIETYVEEEITGIEDAVFEGASSKVSRYHRDTEQLWNAFQTETSMKNRRYERTLQFSDDEFDAETSFDSSRLTVSGYLFYEFDKETLPEEYGYSIVVNQNHVPVSVVQTENISMVPMNEAKELPFSESGQNREDWERAHEKLQHHLKEKYGGDMPSDIMIICEEFKKVYPE